MSEREQQQSRDREDKSRDCEGADVSPVTGKANVSGASSRRAHARGPRIWVLPTGGGGWFAVSEGDPLEIAESLREAAPEILSPEVKESEGPEVAARGRECVLAMLRDRLHESLFAFFSRGLLAGAFVTASLFGLRLPGWLKELDAILLLLGLGFFGYAVVRHGLAAVRLNNRRVDAENAFTRAKWKESPLAGRLALALRLRQTIKPEERGARPDDELLDANAFRKLITEGITTRAEICALGDAIGARLGLDQPGGHERKISDIARAAGLDAESAILYRDLAAAAAQIKLDASFEAP